MALELLLVPSKTPVIPVDQLGVHFVSKQTKAKADQSFRDLMPLTKEKEGDTFSLLWVACHHWPRLILTSDFSLWGKKKKDSKECLCSHKGGNIQVTNPQE